MVSCKIKMNKYIVVDQPLTGFDTLDLNMLYVEQKAGLIQSDSCTSRIADMKEKRWAYLELVICRREMRLMSDAIHTIISKI